MEQGVKKGIRVSCYWSCGQVLHAPVDKVSMTRVARL